MEHAFILGSMDCTVANNFTGKMSCQNHGMTGCRSTFCIKEDSQDRIGIAGQPEWDGQNETGRLGQAGQDKPNRTRRTGLLEKGYQDRTTSQIRTAKIALPGHDC
jgi:hypothetical protein